MLRAEQAIADIRAAYAARAAAAWRGWEREFVIELVRGLDEAAFAFTMAPNHAQLMSRDVNRYYILAGAASGLRPFLQALHDDGDGVPWGPTSREKMAAADQYLMNSGRLAILQRVAALERYGLAEVNFTRDDHLVIGVAPDPEEEAETEIGAKLANRARRALSGRLRELAAQKPQVAAQLDAYAWVVDGWTIGYDNDEALVAYHREMARIRASGTAEAEALPAAASIGGRAFAQWNEASVVACGGLLQHIAFATRLMATKPGLELRNLLTLFARRDDIAAVWQERGESAAWAGRIVSGLTLDARSAIQCERDHEMPLPYYIDFGRHFLLMPVFGGLMNPCAGLVWHLRAHHRTDWDRSVGGREAIFRADLQRLFAPPRYIVPSTGFKLRRGDGSELTDVDTVVLDRTTGDLVLIQLKWPDIYGRSLAERNSRRINLLKANDWVDAVAGWLGQRTAADVAAHMGLGPAGAKPPVLLVLARHAARFAGESGYDPRARWMSWPRLAEAFRSRRSTGIVAAMNQERTRSSMSRVLTIEGLHRLPGLTVEIRRT